MLTGAVPIGYSFLPEVSRHREQEARIEELKAEIEKQRLILVRHQREEDLLKHDPAYVEMIARDRLDLMKEGETIYRVPASSPVPSQMRLNR